MEGIEVSLKAVRVCLCVMRLAHLRVLSLLGDVPSDVVSWLFRDAWFDLLSCMRCL